MKKISLSLQKVLLAVCILLSVGGMVYFGAKKEGYHVDELYSYGLANSEYLPFLHFGTHDYNVKEWMMEYGAGESLLDLGRNLVKDFQILRQASFHIKETVLYQDYVRAQTNSSDTRTTTWVSGQYYRDYLAVTKQNAFNYASVYYNQRGDVHPPLYYILLHTVCSFFQGKFSKWFGLALNLVLMTLVLALFYHMIRKYLGGEKVALAAAAVYGLSAGFMSTALLFRMYALMTLWVLGFFCVNLRIHAEGFAVSKKSAKLLFAVTLLGFLSHYYFVLYAIFTAFGMCVWMLWNRKIKSLVNYVFTLALSAGVGLCVWPFAIRHVFSGYRGKAAIGAIVSGQFSLLRFRYIADHIVREMLGSRYWLLLIPIAAGVVLLAEVFLGKKKKEELPIGKTLLLVLPVFAYALVVAQIAPYLADRYVMCAYPFLCLVMTEAFRVIGREGAALAGKADSRIPTAVLAAGSAVLFLLCGCLTNTPTYLAIGGQETVRLPEGTACVYVLPDGDWNESASDTSILAQCSQVALCYLSSLPVVFEGYDKQADYMLIAVHGGLDVPALTEEIKAGLGIADWTEVSRTEGAVVRMLYAPAPQ